MLLYFKYNNLVRHNLCFKHFAIFPAAYFFIRIYKYKAYLRAVNLSIVLVFVNYIA